jgi:hypothetical protein
MPGLMVAMALIGALIGVGSTLAWQTYGHLLTAGIATVRDQLTAVLARPPQQTAPEGAMPLELRRKRRPLRSAISLAI